MEFLEEMPYDPISFRFHSLAASTSSGSLLTWLAVLAAAAVGFWRMRSGSRSDASSLLLNSSSPSEETLKKAVAVPEPVREEPVRSTETEMASPSCSDGANTPKIRFTAYFDSQDSIGSCHVEDEDDEEQYIDDESNSCEDESDYQEVSLPPSEKEVKYWEETAVRKRDLGWYSYQDMAVLNGNVVRLWDSDSISSPRKRKTGRLAISSF